MELNAIATERTTAATDLLLTLAALVGARYLRRGRGARWRELVWSGVFFLMAVAAFLGGVAHGFALPDPNTLWLWGPAYLALGVMLALFTAGTVHDCWGEGTARRILPALLIAALLYCVLILFLGGDFLLFVLVEALVMLFALGSFTLAAVRRLPGSALTATGILVTIGAALVQTRSSLRLIFIWEFDNNGIFHLVQLAGIALLVAGLSRKRTGRPVV